MKKKEILETVISRLKENVKGYENNLDTLGTSADIDENATIDADERSQQDQATDISRQLQEPLTNLENNINTIKSFESLERDKLETGALVETEDNYFLIGVAVSPMEVNGKKLLGITSDAPAYTSLEGRKKGDIFGLGDKKFTILSIS